MIKKLLIKSLLVATALLLQFNLWAQTIPPITLEVEAGSLKSLLGGRVNQITDLTLTGNLNGDDIRTIRGMAALSVLDIKDTNIVEGGGAYYGDYTTSNNVIGNYMFYQLPELTNITIPKNITSIGYSAFEHCMGLTSVLMGDNVISIGYGAFSSCSGLANITIPNSVISIGDFSFFACIGLKSITIPDSVISIGNNAFYYCTGLISAIIGNSVTSIGSNVFYKSELKEIHSKNPTPPAISSNTFLGIDKTLCRLYVPKGTYNAYWRTWGFDDIIEEEVSSINIINKDITTIQSTSRGIIIEANEQVSVSVYDLSGQIVYQPTIVGNAEIFLNKGVYVVKINNERRKIVVK